MSEIEKTAALKALVGYSRVGQATAPSLPDLRHLYNEEMSGNDRAVARPTALCGLLVLLAMLYGGEAAAKEKATPVFELAHMSSYCPKYYFDDTPNPNYFKGGCPHYTIKIYADGRVHYQGHKVRGMRGIGQAVRVVADRYGKITQAQLAELVKTFESFPLEDIQRYKDSFLEGYVSVSGIIKYKTQTQDLSIDFIPFFYVMTTKINEFINLEKWICFPEGHVEHDDCLLKYRPKYEGF